MGERVSVEQLEERSKAFFNGVVELLKERNIPRGDSYLENDLEELAGLMREKTGRVKTALRVLDQMANLPPDTHPGRKAEKKTLDDLADHFTDVAGYAVLCVIWMQENMDYDVTEFIKKHLSSDGSANTSARDARTVS